MSANQYKCVLEDCRRLTAHPDHLLCPEHSREYLPTNQHAEQSLTLPFATGFCVGVAVVLLGVLLVLL